MAEQAQVDGGIYDQIVRSVVDHLHRQGFSEVMARAQGFAVPERVRWEEGHEGVVPHITARYNKAVYVFDIETRNHINEGQVEDRWRLLSAYARRHQGKFYLVIPESRADYLEKVVSSLDVRLEFLKLSGID